MQPDECENEALWDCKELLSDCLTALLEIDKDLREDQLYIAGYKMSVLVSQMLDLARQMGDLGSKTDG